MQKRGTTPRGTRVSHASSPSWLKIALHVDSNSGVWRRCARERGVCEVLDLNTRNATPREAKVATEKTAPVTFIHRGVERFATSPATDAVARSSSETAGPLAGFEEIRVMVSFEVMGSDCHGSSGRTDGLGSKHPTLGSPTAADCPSCSRILFWLSFHWVFTSLQLERPSLNIQK